MQQMQQMRRYNEENVQIPQQFREKRFVLPQPLPVVVHYVPEKGEQWQHPEVEAMKHSDQYHSFNISGGKWKDHGYEYLMRKVQLWGIRGSFYLHGNLQPTIIKSLIITSMPSLKLLSLKNNEIQTIELLCKIDAPCLGQLDLNNNNLTSIKSISKGYFPELVRINIAENKIYDHSPINKLGSPDLAEICLDQPMKKSRAWLMKLQNAYLQSLDCMENLERPIRSKEKFNQKFKQAVLSEHRNPNNRENAFNFVGIFHQNPEQRGNYRNIGRMF